MSDGAFDAIVLGGAFSGAATATLLRRFRPATRLPVVEGPERLELEVGESTFETSAPFVHRGLGPFDLLTREHLPKHGRGYGRRVVPLAGTAG